MPARRNNIKGAFDPNKSDSDDENYEVETKSRSRKSTKRSRPQAKKSASKARRRRQHSDDDISEGSEESEADEESFSDGSEPVEVDEVTGRPKRRAKAAAKNYAESEDEEKDVKSEEIEEAQPSPKRQNSPKRQKIVKLKVATDPVTGRGLRRAGISAARPPAMPSARRHTRATTAEAADEEFVELSTSGRHVVATRPSRTPEAQPAPTTRPTRGAKGVKQQPPIMEASHESSSFEHPEENVPMIQTDIPDANPTPERSIHDSFEEDGAGNSGGGGVQEGIADGDVDVHMGDKEVDGEVDADAKADNDTEDDDDDDPIGPKPRSRKPGATTIALMEDEEEGSPKPTTRTRRSTRASGRATKEQGSDFEPDDHESVDDDLSGSDGSPKKNKGDADDDDDESIAGRGRSARLGRTSRKRRAQDDSDFEDGQSPEKEAAGELSELVPPRRAKRARSEIQYEVRGKRNRAMVNYQIPTLNEIAAVDDEPEESGTPSRKGRGRNDNGRYERNWASTYGPFGGVDKGKKAVVRGPWDPIAAGGADSDSSDDEGLHRPIGLGGNMGMTPTSALAPALLPGIGQTHNADTGAPTGLGRVKSGKALADADPLGVDPNVDFSKIGGLDSHIDQLKEMVQMPLLYPEIFMKLKVTPPRGVLFHGPPGTGKTLVARALAASVGSQGQKVTFYMRKGADALSKWVGEAERQLRLLFEEARKTQPSIIFFDEIDGLAPVRSSKQEQIHASIVSTLLALMDGMDGRGQVIVIGATNRPDNIDPALRRPGRFDREFYFALPDSEARRSIINIHTENWGLDGAFKDELARQTKGYGGADLRALCTEASLNAVQRTYPQIYSSSQKLVIDPDKIKITAKDFMLSIKKIVPSSQRSTSSGAVPLPKTVEPLLQNQLDALKRIVDDLIPIKKKVTALQEAMYEQYEDNDNGFGREILQQEFEKARVFRPRLLIRGREGMGQGHLGAALLNYFEGLHVQTFDLAKLYDSDKSPEATVIQLFAEVKRHKPSVIYLPDVHTWWRTVSEQVITTFVGMLKSIPATDPVLVLGITDTDDPEHDLDSIFNVSRKNTFIIEKPSEEARRNFFSKIVEYAYLTPEKFPDPANRKKRKLEELPLAPPPPPREPTAAEIHAQHKRDRQVLNQVKIRLQPLMDEIKKKFKVFNQPAIPRSSHEYLLNEQDSSFVRPDVSQPDRPYELDHDEHGITVLRETATGKTFYNLELPTIEERLVNGVYCRPGDFFKDIERLAKDNLQLDPKANKQNPDRRSKADNLLVNVDVDVTQIEMQMDMQECEAVYQRQLRRKKALEEKRRKKAEAAMAVASIMNPEVPEEGNPTQQGTSNVRQLEGSAATSQLPVLPPISTPGLLSNGHGPNSFSPGVQSLRFGNGFGSTGMDFAAIAPERQPPHQTHGMPPPQQWPPIRREPSTISNHTSGIITRHTQESSFYRLSPGVSPSQVDNDASTTASLKGTQYPQTPRSPDARSMFTMSSGRNTSENMTNPRLSDLSMIVNNGMEPIYDSQIASQADTLPSTLEQNNTQERDFEHHLNPAIDLLENSWVSSQARVQPFTQSSGSPGGSSSQKPVSPSDEAGSNLLHLFVDGSKDCTMEMMEQIYRELMVTIWNSRGEFNRANVFTALVDSFEETVQDMKDMRARN